MTWTGRKVLLTGADGFIGSHLAEALVRGGAEVRALCLYNSNGSAGWLDDSPADIRRSLDVRLGDIRDSRFVEAVMQGVDVVFHLAALIAIPYSYVAPESFVDTNVRGTLNVLEAVRRAGCSRVVHASTSEVYGTPDTVPIVESHPLHGQSPYSASKIGADKLAEAYYCSYGVPVVTLRPFNTYGPRQSARALIPAVLAQLLGGVVDLKVGSLTPRRDLTFVADTVLAFLAAGSAPGIEGTVVHTGTGRAESVEAIVNLAMRVCGVEVRVVQDPARVRPRSSEVTVLQADASRAARVLGWHASVKLEEGLRMTADWMREHLHRYRPGENAI